MCDWCCISELTEVVLVPRGRGWGCSCSGPFLGHIWRAITSSNIRHVCTKISSFGTLAGWWYLSWYISWGAECLMMLSLNSFHVSVLSIYILGYVFRGVVWAYCKTNAPVGSPNFDAICPKIYLVTATILLFLVCSTNFTNFFDYNSSCHEVMTSSHSQVEVLYSGELTSTYTTGSG